MYQYLGEILSRLDWSQRMYTYIPLYCSSKSPFEFTDNQARQRWLAGVMLVALVLAVEPLRRKKSFQWEILRPRESFKRREEKYISRYTQDWAPRITWTDKKDKKSLLDFPAFTDIRSTQVVYQWKAFTDILPGYLLPDILPGLSLMATIVERQVDLRCWLINALFVPGLIIEIRTPILND